MIGVAKRILGRAPEVLFHDELGEFYAPQLLADVAALAAAEGMTYLADTRPHMSEETLFPSAAAAPLRERADGDWLRFQKYLDFQQLRSFHNAVFVKGAPDRRRVADRLPGLWASCSLREVAADPAKPNEAVFETVSNVRMSTNDPRLVALFRKFAQAYPQALPLDGVADLEALADHVFRLFVSGVMGLATAPPRLAREAGERPLASSLARLQSARGERDLATLTHGVLRIEGGPLVALLALLDGTRGAPSWREIGPRRRGSTRGKRATGWGEALNMLARAGVLMG